MDVTRRTFPQATCITLLLETQAIAKTKPYSDQTGHKRMLQRIQEAHETYKRATWIKDALHQVANYSEIFKDAERDHEISKFYLAGICMKETMGVPYLKSSKGALGPMQVMPNTATTMGYTPSSITCSRNQSYTNQQKAIENNIHCAAKYLNYARTIIIETYPSKERSEQGFLTLAAYAGGLGTINEIMQYYPHFTNLSNTSPLHQYVVRVNALTMLVEENRQLFGYTT